MNLRLLVVSSTLAIALTACGSDRAGTSDSPGPAPESYLGLTTPDRGFQLRTVGADIGPGEEREYCEIARIPGAPTDVYHVSSLELANAASSHHLALALAARGSPAEHALQALGAGTRIECPGPGLAFGEGIELISTIQARYGRAALPEGVAREYHGGDLIVFDYHYANAGLETVHARSAANFHLVEPAAVEHVAQGFALNDVTIDIPPGTTASVTGECHYGTDMMVGSLTRHTHRWGAEFSVWHSGGARDGQRIWTSLDWEHETEHTFAEPLLLRAGEGFRYRCTYANDTARHLRFGVSINDEMCMLYGPAWPAHRGEELRETYCNVTWVDQEGIGHPATEAGGFPEPSPADTAICTGALGASLDSCASCVCSSCANPGLRCATDADCATMLACLIVCRDVACAQGCQALIQKHSSGAGRFVSAAECVRAECPGCLPAGG